MRRIMIMAGPNGAGKTTWTRELLREAPEFTFHNADLIADEIAPGRPETAALEAGRRMLEDIEQSLSRGDSFVLETTLSGRSYARMIPAWRDAGYWIGLSFFMLASPEQAIARVAARVAQGGHHIPPDVVRRRYFSGLRNLHELYKPLVDSWSVFDTSGPRPRLVEQGP